MNRLSVEKSPYLLQHAHNPVDWRAWGPEAFEEARRQDKPLLVSIGYSTCHWCHVMERESFENPEIAAVMNAFLVCVKVDREERPDVDKVYMTAVQALTGQGGWPLNVFLTPDGKPFIGGTYFPPRDGFGRPGWPSLVRRIGEAWKDPGARREMTERGRELLEGLSRHLSAPAAVPPGFDPAATAAAALPAAFSSFLRSNDAAFGGFSPAPKFPMPVNQHFIFRAWAFDKESAEGTRVRDMALEALRAMARGGIRDHLGGGFARYSVDERWHVPHFEKMLYDNAQLAANFTDAFLITGEAAFADAARETLDYVLRDMTHPEGGFFSAEDADSLASEGAGEKREGAFYVWEEGEIDQVLGAARAKIFNAAYGVEPGGNVLQDPHGEFPLKNVLFRALTDEQIAARFGVPPAEVAVELAAARKRLFEVRARRPRPSLDDKVLAAWNGLMISALSRAARAFDAPRYAEAARRAGEFAWARLSTASSAGRRFFRRWRDGEAAVPAMADDAAFLAQGFLDLYEALLDPLWLDRADETARELEARFVDAAGAVAMTAKDHDPLVPFRVHDDGDNVEPAAAGVAAAVFLRLGRYRGEAERRALGVKILSLLGGAAAEDPRRFPNVLAAILSAAREPAHLVVAGPPDGEGTRSFWRAVNRRFLPDALLFPADGGPAQAALAARLPYLKDMKAAGGRPTGYLCRDFACRAPASDPEAWAGQLGEI